jgi:hypothetical protein
MPALLASPYHATSQNPQDSGLAPFGAPRNDVLHNPKIALAMICF